MIILHRSGECDQRGNPGLLSTKVLLVRNATSGRVKPTGGDAALSLLASRTCFADERLAAWYYVTSKIRPRPFSQETPHDTTWQTAWQAG